MVRQSRGRDVDTKGPRNRIVYALLPYALSLLQPHWAASTSTGCACFLNITMTLDMYLVHFATAVNSTSFSPIHPTMDPLTTLGLAANLIACVSFLSDLVKGAIEIGASENGCSSDVSQLETVYKDLERLCTDLQPGIDQQIISGTQDVVRNSAFSIKSLSQTCKEDCIKLLELLSRLKCKAADKGKWESFRVALRRHWKSSEIHRLESRLSRTQQTLTLHVSKLA
jgi:hypothetical protein